MTTALFSCLYKPFQLWKFTERNFTEARRRGFETVVAWDHRNSPEDYDRIKGLADKVITFQSRGFGEDGIPLVHRASSDFALLLADDEVPSAPLWEFAANPPGCARYEVPVIPIIGDKVYWPFVGVQERIIWIDGWAWKERELPDGSRTPFDALPESSLPVASLADSNELPFFPSSAFWAPGQTWRERGLLVWHHLLGAPRQEREEKAKRYSQIDPWGEYATRVLWEERVDQLIPIPDDLRRFL